MRGIVAKDGDGSVDDGIREPGFFALYEKKEPFVASGEFFALGSGFFLFLQTDRLMSTTQR